MRGDGTTAVYRYDAAGNRVAVDHVKAFDPSDLRARVQPAPRVGGVSPARVAQNATIIVQGSGFGSAPMDNVVRVGGAIGRVLDSSPTELRVQLPPGATPGPVSVETAWGRSTSKDDLVVTPAEVDPAPVSRRIEADVGKSVEVPASSGDSQTLLTFHGKAGESVALQGCDGADVGLAGPTGTIIEADAGDASWCDRPALLPMTGTYTATITTASELRATVSVTDDDPYRDQHRLATSPITKVSTQSSDPPARDGPAVLPVDLSSGRLAASVTDLALGGSGQPTSLARSTSAIPSCPRSLRRNRSLATGASVPRWRWSRACPSAISTSSCPMVVGCRSAACPKALRIRRARSSSRRAASGPGRLPEHRSSTRALGGSCARAPRPLSALVAPDHRCGWPGSVSRRVRLRGSSAPRTTTAPRTATSWVWSPRTGTGHGSPTTMTTGS